MNSELPTPTSLTALCWSLSLAALVLLILRSVYYLTAHPLSRYPGPLLARVTSLASLWHRADGSNHSWPLELHRRYGHVVRVGPNELSYTHADAWHDIYAKAGGGGDVPKDFVGLGTDMAAPEKGIIRTDDANHARQRRIFSHAFSERAVMRQEALIRGHVMTLMDKLADVGVGSGPVDLTTWLGYLAFDIMGDLTFGESLGMLHGNADALGWVRDSYAAIKTVTLGMALQGWHRPLGPWLLKYIWGGSAKRRAQHNRFSMDRVDRRLARKADDDEGHDVWAIVMQNSGGPRGSITRGEMYSNAATFMIGGTETTTALTSALTYLLLRHPDKMATLRAEVDGAVRSRHDLTFSNLRRLAYLKACIEEGMRLYPPAPTPMPRLVPAGGRVLCGRFVAAGTRVDVPLYAMFRHPDHFADADDFVPERWLAEGARPSRYAADRRDVVKAFSAGPRDCIGQTLAYNEMRLIMASLLWHFDLVLHDAAFDWMQQKSYGIWDKHPLRLSLTPRAGARALG